MGLNAAALAKSLGVGIEIDYENSGMGVVYKAEDVKLGRFVALKFPAR